MPLVHSVCDQLGECADADDGYSAKHLGWVRFCQPRGYGIIARKTGTHRVEIQGVVSFYAFFSEQPQGGFVILDSVMTSWIQFSGLREVQASF